MAEQRLAVFMNRERVGTLWRADGGALCFAYDARYREAAGALPLSRSLPLSPDPFEEGPARLFFANLLPEGRQRQFLARRLGLSENNDFDLLAAIGGECAGAVSLLLEGQAPSETGEYRPVDKAELRHEIESLPRRPMLAGEEGVRLSLAGAQGKLPIWYRQGAFRIPTGGPSTHILKPPAAEEDGLLYGSVANEFLVMRLAERMGLPTARVFVEDVNGPVLLVERYDRTTDPEGGLARLHQEDFCQALGIAPDRKYEAEGGPGLADCFGLVRQVVRPPLPAFRSLVDWTLFNFLVGNADAHAKNLSLLYSTDGPHLAPFYDLLCTAVYPDLTPQLAMGIGGERRPEWIMARHWQRFAQACGLGWPWVRQRLLQMAEELPVNAEAIVGQVAGEVGEQPILEQIIRVITERCGQVQREWQRGNLG